MAELPGAGSAGAPLHAALAAQGPGLEARVRALLAARADPDEPGPPLRERPLHVVLRRLAVLPADGASEALGVARCLLEGRADPNAADALGETALFDAACSGHAAACSLLLDFRADPTAQSRHGSRPADMAANGAVNRVLTGAAPAGGGLFDFDELEELETARRGAGGGASSDAPGAEASEGACVEDAPLFDFAELAESEGRFSDLRRRPMSPTGVPGPAGAEARPAPPPPAQPPPGPTRRSAQALREEGNEHFRAGRHREARRAYTEALAEDPTSAVLLSNRAAACLMLGDWEAAAQDALEAVRRDPSNAKACERVARGLLLQNRLQEAMSFCRARLSALAAEQTAAAWQPFVAIAQRVAQHAAALHRMEEALAKGAGASDESEAAWIVHSVATMQAVLSQTELASPLAERLGFVKVRALLLPLPGASGQTPQQRTKWAREAEAELALLLKQKPTWPDTHHWLARCKLRLGLRRDARSSLTAAMRHAGSLGGQHLITEELLDSMSITERQRDVGNEAFRQCDWAAALACYNEAIRADVGRWDVELSAQMHFNRSSVLSKLGRIAEAFDDASIAVALRPDYAKALFRRALLLVELERYGEAVADFERVAALEPRFVGLGAWLPRARAWAARPPRWNYHALLGVAYDAGPAEVKRAYRAAALRWHPDKHGEGDRQEAERRFKDIAEAYEALSGAHHDAGEARCGPWGGPPAPPWRQAARAGGGRR